MTKEKQSIDELLEELRVSSAKHYKEFSNVNIKFKKLHKDAVLPTYAKPGDAGMDCVAVNGPEFHKSYVRYNLGFAMEIPRGYVGLIFPRSSISKKDLMLANAVGVIDSDYRGEVQARFKAIISEDTVNKAPLDRKRNEYVLQHDTYSKGDKVCQLIIVPIPKVTTEWVDELSETVRGEGGHGSSGE